MSGKTCLVTGATSGIGQETALRLAMLGATVIIVARDAARGETAADEIRRRVPLAQVESVTADLSSLAQVGERGNVEPLGDSHGRGGRYRSACGRARHDG
jgi:short-subunit dehydrogenase